MSTAKDLVIRQIEAKAGNAFIREHHYSGKVVNNSQIHLGAFWGGVLEGALQFGPSLDKRKIQGLVRGSQWHEFIELNRLAFSDALPRNSESRALAVSMRLLRKHAPQLKWVVSFADGTQCGDGTIYRASGFLLTAINVSHNLAQLPSGAVVHKMTLESNPTAKREELGMRSYYEITGGRYDFGKYVRTVGGRVIPGFQLRYIYFLDPSYRERLTVPVLPFSEIEARGARMYRGERICAASKDSVVPGHQPGEGGANPTAALQEIQRDDAG